MLHFLIVFNLFFNVAPHDFHVSITSGEYNSKTKSLQLFVKVFSDDLELEIKEKNKVQLRLGESDQHPDSDSLISNYVFDHFWIKQKDQLLEMQYVGMELEQDIVFIYLELPVKNNEKTITVSNTLFFDRFDDQSNIVNLKWSGPVQSAFLDQNNPLKTLNF